MLSRHESQCARLQDGQFLAEDAGIIHFMGFSF